MGTLGALLTMAGVALGLYGLFRLVTRPAGPETARDWIVVPGDSLAYHLRRLDSVEARLGRVRGQMDLIHREAASVDSLQRQAGLRDVARLRAELAALGSRVDTLDRVILSDPTRALQLVLVERDVAQLRESVQGTVASVRREIDLVSSTTSPSM